MLFSKRYFKRLFAYIKHLFINFFKLLYQSYIKWQAHKAPRMGAALSYYVTLSFAPLTILVLLIVSNLLGDAADNGLITQHISNIVGYDIALFIQDLIENASSAKSRYSTTIIGIVVVIFGASNGVTYLKESLNIIWEVHPKKITGFLAFIKKRLISIGIILIIVLAFIIIMVVSPILGSLKNILLTNVPIPIVKGIFNNSINFLIIIISFATIFKILPDIRIPIKDVLPGSIFTAILFKIGDFFIKIYLKSTFITSVFGAAGSLVIMLLWIYYLAQIIYFGAEFTQLYSRNYGNIMKINGKKSFINSLTHLKKKN